MKSQLQCETQLENSKISDMNTERLPKEMSVAKLSVKQGVCLVGDNVYGREEQMGTRCSIR